MLQHLSVADLCRLLAHGAGMTLAATPFSLQDLSLMAGNAKAGNARLTLTNWSHFDVNSLCHIAANGGGMVELA